LLRRENRGERGKGWGERRVMIRNGEKRKEKRKKVYKNTGVNCFLIFLFKNKDDVDHACKMWFLKKRKNKDKVFRAQMRVIFPFIFIKKI